MAYKVDGQLLNANIQLQQSVTNTARGHREGTGIGTGSRNDLHRADQAWRSEYHAIASSVQISMS